jgi:small subunit ribosomal protein S21
VIHLTKVAIREGESFERALKRFKKRVEQAGVLKEVRKREHFLKPSVQEKLKRRAAEARSRKREKRLTQRVFS